MADTREQPKQESQAWYVAGPGSIHYDGKVYLAGQQIPLRPDDAKSLGKMVTRTKPSQPEPPGKRPAGKYRWLGPGMVWTEGKQQGPGAILTLSSEDAEAMGSMVRPVQ